MKTSMTVVAGAIGTGVLLAATVAGCGNDSKPAASSASSTSSTSAAASSTSAAPAQPTDYTGLLIKSTDISAPEVFTAGPPTPNPNGHPGVATSYSNPDGSHVIGTTILVLPDAAAAAGALDGAKAALSSSVAGGTPGPAGVGTGGTTVSGNSPDGSKSVTVVLFTEGKAFATLEFDGPPGAAAPPDFVTDISQKQDAAIKTGLPG
ncbi:hypothetical protein ABIA30_005465 [Mycobacterium sp. MAA66]|uniref:hypothetical protein n=1 Tax=Mycobacterium sp. MAA66 TaxID=3156297 RepID=UPI003519176D